MSVVVYFMVSPKLGLLKGPGSHIPKEAFVSVPSVSLPQSTLVGLLPTF